MENYNNKYNTARLESIFKKGAEMVYNNLRYGLNVPEYVPTAIKREGELLFKKRLNGIPIEYAGATRNLSAIKSAGSISTMESDFQVFNDSGWTPPASMYTTIDHKPRLGSKLFDLFFLLLAVILLFKARGLLKGLVRSVFMWLLSIIK